MPRSNAKNELSTHDVKRELSKHDARNDTKNELSTHDAKGELWTDGETNDSEPFAHNLRGVWFLPCVAHFYSHVILQ